MKYSGIGGQAVIEGVMMKNAREYAVAVRKPDNQIEVNKQESRSVREKYRLLNAPIVRGIVTFVESLVLGMRTLNYSASFFEEEAEKEEKKSKEAEETKEAEEVEEIKETKEAKEGKEGLLMGLLVAVAIVAAIGIFVLAPFFISEALRRPIPSDQLRGLIEGVIRVLLFVLYVKLISMMEDIRRVFMYHGAEHKAINCVENGCELTVENVRRQTMVHRRCGTSFLLIVMFISILFFMFIVVGNIWLRMALRILLVPVIAGLAYEYIRFAGNHDNAVISVLNKPGLWLQSLTTKEPTDDMIEVAIASVDAVFDWRSFIAGAAETEEETAEPVSAEDGRSGEAAEPVSAEDGQSGEAADSLAAAEEESEDIEILDIEGEEEDDEILNALDRYFEAPESGESEQE